jgi:sialic acid synthase SpsE
MAQVRIDKRLLGDGQPPFIILEAGINHNGELEKAYEMIRVARAAGADAVKFQTFKADEFIGDPELTYTYRSQGREVTESMLEMFRRYEFSREEWFAIKKKCDEENILFLSTPQNPSDLDLLLEIGIPAIKVGSDDFTNLPLLKDYASTCLPMLVSCGMANLAEVYQALETIGTLDGYPTVLLFCTSQYPTPPQDVNLLKLTALKQAFPMVVMGFSDHTQGHIASALGLALGAKLFEKHFTLDHNLAGPDHWFSEDPISTKNWIDTIRLAAMMMGNSIVRPTPAEELNKREFQRVIVAAREIAEGEVYSRENLTMRRVSQGHGLAPALFQLMIGRIARKDYRKYEPVE